MVFRKMLIPPDNRILRFNPLPVAQRFGLGQRGFITSRDKKNWMRKKHVIASMDRLECSKRCENIIHRKIIIFYIEAIPQIFSQLRQKIFFRARSKYFPEFFGHFGF